RALGTRARTIAAVASPEAFSTTTSSAPAASASAAESSSAPTSSALCHVTMTMLSSAQGDTGTSRRASVSRGIALRGVERMAGIAEDDAVRARHLPRKHVEIGAPGEARRDPGELLLGGVHRLLLRRGRRVETVPAREPEI